MPCFTCICPKFLVGQSPTGVRKQGMRISTEPFANPMFVNVADLIGTERLVSMRLMDVGWSILCPAKYTRQSCHQNYGKRRRLGFIQILQSDRLFLSRSNCGFNR